MPITGWLEGSGPGPHPFSGSLPKAPEGCVPRTVEGPGRRLSLSAPLPYCHLASAQTMLTQPSPRKGTGQLRPVLAPGTNPSWPLGAELLPWCGGLKSSPTRCSGRPVPMAGPSDTEGPPTAPAHPLSHAFCIPPRCRCYYGTIPTRVPWGLMG